MHEIGVLGYINQSFGVPEQGYFTVEGLPETLDPTAIWDVIFIQGDEPNCEYRHEWYWGIDVARDGSLYCAKPTEGDAWGVEPEEIHIVGAHCHPDPGVLARFNPFTEDAVEIAPREMAHMLDTHQYAEFIFRRRMGMPYPCTLALKTLEASINRYESMEDTKQELSLLTGVAHNPVWSRERNLLQKSDGFVHEKGIAIYRGTIVPGASQQAPLHLVARVP